MPVHFRKRLAVFALPAVFASACVAIDKPVKPVSPGDEGGSTRGFTVIDELPVDVYFLKRRRDDGSTTYCPRFVSRPFIRLKDFENTEVVKEIVWTARILSEPNEPYTGGYKIYFSPSSPLDDLIEQEHTGVIRSGPIPLSFIDAPRDRGYDIEFKYTIIGDDCPEQPLDPRMRVD